VDEAGSRFAPYAEAACPCLEENAHHLASSIRSTSVGCVVSGVWRVDPATTASVFAASAAGAGTQVMSTLHLRRSKYPQRGLSATRTELESNSVDIMHSQQTGCRYVLVAWRVRTLLAECEERAQLVCGCCTHYRECARMRWRQAYSLPEEKGRPNARTARLPPCRSGDVTHKASCCAMHIACSS